MTKIEPQFNSKGKLILVTAMTSNKTGIGKNSNYLNMKIDKYNKITGLI